MSEKKLFGKAMVAEFASWAKANGLPKPKNQSQLDSMMHAFLTRGEQGRGPAWDEIPDDRVTHLVDDGATVQIADPMPQGPFKDDWQLLLEQRASASIGPNGESLDDFDTEFQLIGEKQTELQKAAPFTRINPVTVLNGRLGTNVTVQSGVDPIQVASWTGEDAETTPVTITIVPVNQLGETGIESQYIATDPYRAFARIQFGTAGYSAIAEVDVGLGCQFTISASNVLLALGIEGVASPPVTMNLTGMLSFGPVVRTAQLTRTVVVSVPSTSAAYVVPAFAKSVTFWRQTVSQAATIGFYGKGGALLYSYLLAANAYMFDPIPLSNEVVFATVFNATGSPLFGELIFNLAL